jgi:hypothetical protein
VSCGISGSARQSCGWRALTSAIAEMLTRLPVLEAPAVDLAAYDSLLVEVAS